MPNGDDFLRQLARQLNEGDRANYEALRSHFGRIMGMPAEEIETPFLAQAFPPVEEKPPEVEAPRIPPEGIPYPLQSPETAEEFPAVLKPDYTVWLGEEQIGTAQPETYEFTPKELPFYQRVLGTVLGGLGRGIEWWERAYPKPIAAMITKPFRKPEEMKEWAKGIPSMTEMGIMPAGLSLAEKHKWVEQHPALVAKYREEAAKLFPYPEETLEELFEREIAEYEEEVPLGVKIGIEAGVEFPLYILLGQIPVFKWAGNILKRMGIKMPKILPKPKPKLKIPKQPPELPRIEKMITAQRDPSAMAALNEVTATKILNPMRYAKTPAEKATIAWMGMRDASPSLATIEVNVIRAKPNPFIVDLVTGLVKNVKPRKPMWKPYILAIAEHPDRYILNKAQWAYLNLSDDILKAQLSRELVAGVKVPLAKLKPGQRYIPRFVKELQDLTTKATSQIRRGYRPRRPGVRPGVFRDRYYEEVLDGVAKGKVYEADLAAAIEMRLTVGNNAIADKVLADFLKPLGKLPMEKIPTVVIRKAQETAYKFRGIKDFQKVVNRAIRGERPVAQTLKAQERRFPELATKLQKALAIEKVSERNTALKAVLKEARTLEPTLKKAYWQARTARVKALRVARRPILGGEGTINHAGLEGRLFPVEMSDPVNKLITGEITPSRVLQQIAKVNAVARMGQTAIDTGFALIQGLMTLANHPKNWGKAFVVTMKTLKNPRHAAQFFKVHKNTARAVARHGGAPYGSSEFTVAARPGGWLEKIPGFGKVFRRFGYAFETWIDTARTLNVEAKYAVYTRKLGRHLNNREMVELVTSCDHMVGISSLRRLGVSAFTRDLLSNTLYAPRYYGAFVSFLTSAFKGGIAGDISRKALAKFLVAIPSFMTALAYALGQEERVIPTKDKPIPVMFDPRTGELMGVVIAGTHMGLGGVWIAGFRLLGSLVRTAQDDPTDFVSLDPHENPFLRYGYGRASPVASATIDIATGRNFLGERLDTPDDYLDEIIDKTFPFWLAGALTDVPKAGWEKGAAEWWGLRAWMVQYRELARRYAEAHIKDIPNNMIMDWQREKIATGATLTYDDLNNEQRAWLLETFEDYRQIEEKRKERQKETGTDFQVADIEVREMLDIAYHTDLSSTVDGILAGAVTINDYNEQAEYLRRIRQGQYLYRIEMQKRLDRDRWEDLERWVAERIKPEDEAYDKYMELRGSPPKVAGVPQWDAWKANLDAYLASLTPEMRAYIERRQDDWIRNLPEKVQPVEHLILECETVLDAYYATPQGRERLFLRDRNYEIDAKLFILGRVSKVRSTNAMNLALTLGAKYNIPLQIAEEDITLGVETEQERLRRHLEDIMSGE